MSHNDKETQSLILSEIQGLLAEIEKLAKFMAEKTLQAEVITTRDKLNRQIAHYRQMAQDDFVAARRFAGNAISGTTSHVKEYPVSTAITVFSAAWLVWRIIRLAGKR